MANHSAIWYNFLPNVIDGLCIGQCLMRRELRKKGVDKEGKAWHSIFIKKIKKILGLLDIKLIYLNQIVSQKKLI